MEASERFTEAAAAAFRREVEEAGGNEVFAAARLDEEGKLAEIIVAARGNESAVPALESFISRGDVVIHNHPSGDIRPSDPDLGIASEVGARGIGFYIVDNGVSKVYVVAEPVRRRSLVMLDEDEISSVLDSGGKLSTLIPSFEPRASQVRLVRDIVSALNEGEILAAEAGTGVGKSFAYLVPAFAWAIRNEERVVISTATINLQKQLVDKDIPIVQKLFKKKTKAVLVKGRGNYLCKTKLREALDEEGLFAGPDHPLRRIEAWAETTSSGDRSDLSFWPEEATWSRVASEADTCTGLRCPDRDGCFILRMKREAADAHVIVANHHILFSDLSARMEGAGYEGTAVLPPFQVLVIDEAHAVESSATSYFSKELNRFSLQKRLSRLQRNSRGGSYGLVPRLSELHGFPRGLLEGLPAALAAARAAINRVDEKAVGLFAERERHYRLVERSPLLRDALLAPLAELERSFLAVAEILRDALDEAPEDLAQERAVFEAKLALRRLTETAATAASFKDFDADRDTVFWLEKGKTSQGEVFVTCIASPLDITGYMEEAVFTKFRSVICTSATLSVGESFDFWRGRVGLPKNRAEDGSGVKSRTAVYPSPFPFRTNALLCVDSEAPLPDSPNWKEYVNRAIVGLLAASEGRALVLFTSYEVLKSAYETAKPAMEAMDIVCLRQGEDERSRLLDAFRNDISSVLFATDSFWEGVDAPGETLSLVIITKLPFRVPTDPVQLARSEACERRGGNAFMEISLPEAVIRLKQGFGRLIRHSDDRGAVAILDSRVVKKRYGGLFIESLPECRIVTEGIEALGPAIHKFLFDW
jgi:ATP-dependent DNA helicase DinG